MKRREARSSSTEKTPKVSEEVEKILREECELTPVAKVPSRRKCETILKKHSLVFVGRNKVDIQD